MYHHIDQFIALNPGQKRMQKNWEQFLRHSPDTFTCKRHVQEARDGVSRASFDDPFDLSDTETEDEVIDSGSGTDSSEADAPASTSVAPSHVEVTPMQMMNLGGGSKEQEKPVPVYIKNMLKELVREYGIQSILKEIVN